MSPIRKPARPGSRTSAPGQRVSHGLVALSSAVVMAVYSAGYLRTQAAADRFEAEAGQRRPVVPAPATATAGEPEAGAAPVATTSVAPVAPSAAPTIAEEAAPAVAAPVTTGSPAAKAAPAAVPETPTAAVESGADPITPTSPTAAAASVTQPAPVSVPVPASPAAPAVPAAPRYKDGTFTGWGTSRHGDIEAQVVIVDGRITSASISQCWTRWPCSWIAALPGQVVTRQSPETDFVSGATQSTNAFYYAVVQALGKASLP